MQRPWHFELFLVVIALGAGSLAGWLSGDYSAGVLLGLLAVLGRHLYRLLQLNRDLEYRRRIAPPFPWGAWGQLHTAISEQQQRSRRHKRRQVRFAQRFREAAISVPDALVALDKDFRVEWANPSAAALLGVEWPADQGRTLGAAVPQNELQEYLAQADFELPIELVPAHNRALILSVRLTPFGGKKRQWLVVARDITKVRLLDQSRQDFVANASHELRTPLTVIAGFMETLAESRDTPESMRRPLSLMLQQASRMRSIIDDLLALSRLEPHDRPDQVEAVDVPRLLHQVIGETAGDGYGSHRFEEDIDPELRLLGNPGELRSAFANLIRNAVRHTARGEGIRVIWRNGPQGPMLSVQDSGAGIEPEHIPRITEHFYRPDRGRSRESGGAGLGLSIVSHVIARHQGELLIASEAGGGSAFTCRFAPSAAVVAERLSG